MGYGQFGWSCDHEDCGAGMHMPGIALIEIEKQDRRHEHNCHAFPAAMQALARFMVWVGCEAEAVSYYRYFVEEHGQAGKRSMLELREDMLVAAVGADKFRLEWGDGKQEV